MSFYSNEITFKGHPDKVCDQISDALLDAYLAQDQNSRCGIEVVGGKGKIFVTGEVTSKAKVDVEFIVKSVLSDVGYSTDYEIINNIGIQSPDIAQGVDIGGAGDQGMMCGYACKDTRNYVPTAMAILQDLSKFYARLVKYNDDFLPDGKAQITGFYDENNKLKYIKDFVISYQNKEINREETDKILIDYCKSLCSEYGVEVKQYHINPTGKFLIGGFDGDAGLTGRKLCVDNYHSFAPIGAGALSGKDCTKVDRSAAYKARQIAIEYLNLRPDIYWCEVQLSYAIGMDKPLGIYIKTDKGVIEAPDCLYDECTPMRIIEDLHLKDGTFKYYDTAKFGHFGHGNFPWEKTIINKNDTAIIKEFANFIFSYIEDVRESTHSLRLYFDRNDNKFYSILKEYDDIDFNRQDSEITIYEGEVSDYVYGNNQSEKYLEALDKTNHNLLDMYLAYRKITGIYQNEYITIINFIRDFDESYLLSDVANEAYNSITDIEEKIIHELAEK